MQPLPHHLFLLCAIFETLGPFLHKYDLLLCAISQKLLLLIIHFNNFYFFIHQGSVPTWRSKVCAKMRKTIAAMAPGGRQSKSVRSIPPPDVILAGSSRILKRLKTTRAPEQHVPEDISPITENSMVVTMLCRQNRQ